MDEIQIRHIIGSQYSRTYDYEGAGRQLFIHFLARREKRKFASALIETKPSFSLHNLSPAS